jgi:predicted dehydrogenase
MNNTIRLAVLGAGLIGKRHIEHIIAEPQSELYAVVDPSAAGQEVASAHGVRWYPNFAALIASGKPDGVIIATPNQMHVGNGLEAIAGRPCPDREADRRRHRDRYQAGRRGRKGRRTDSDRPSPAAQSDDPASESDHRCWAAWPDRHRTWIFLADEARRLFRPAVAAIGAGPVLLNLSHDVDLLRYLCGEVEAVQAYQSNAVRSYPVDETTVVILKFANGALGTINVSDTVVAPWSWEQTTGENTAYPHTDQTCYQIGGTHGSLSVPRLELWTNQAKRSWWEPFNVERHVAADQDPLRLQIQQFCRVIRGEEKPLVSGREGLMTLKVIDAVNQAAKTGELVKIEQADLRS